MKYFIGYLISGEAAEWHISITKKISDKFNTWKLHEKLPPHITIFYLEGVEDITEIRNYIKDWVEKNKVSGNFYMSDFDHFDDRVVFAKINVDESVVQTIKNLGEGIIRVSSVLDESFIDWHPHTTLANRLTPEEINNIWEYVNQLDKLNFTLPFNNITIFKFIEDQKWVVDESFELSQF